MEQAAIEAAGAEGIELVFDDDGVPEEVYDEEIPIDDPDQS